MAPNQIMNLIIVIITVLGFGFNIYTYFSNSSQDNKITVLQIENTNLKINVSSLLSKQNDIQNNLTNIQDQIRLISNASYRFELLKYVYEEDKNILNEQINNCLNNYTKIKILKNSEIITNVSKLLNTYSVDEATPILTNFQIDNICPPLIMNENAEPQNNTIGGMTGSYVTNSSLINSSNYILFFSLIIVLWLLLLKYANKRKKMRHLMENNNNLTFNKLKA